MGLDNGHIQGSRRRGAAKIAELKLEAEEMLTANDPNAEKFKTVLGYAAKIQEQSSCGERDKTVVNADGREVAIIEVTGIDIREDHFASTGGIIIGKDSCEQEHRIPVNKNLRKRQPAAA